MKEQFRQEDTSSQEKSADQIYQELNKAHDEVMELMSQVHALEMKVGEAGISKEEFDLRVDERNKLNDQLNEKRETKKQLEEQLRQAEEKEMAALEEEWNELKEKNQ